VRAAKLYSTFKQRDIRLITHLTGKHSNLLCAVNSVNNRVPNLTS